MSASVPPAEISVIIPYYNQADLVREAVRSVLAEAPEAEVLVSDDGSRELPDLEGFSTRVRWIPGERNLGPAAARNRALTRAQGTFVYFLDADDLLCPGGLSEAVGWLRHRPAAPAVCGRVAGVVDEQGHPLPKLRTFGLLDLPSGPELRREFLRPGVRFSPSLSRFVFRRSFLKVVGPLDESLRHAEDWDLVLRALRLAPIPIRDISLFYYRHHSGNNALRLRDDVVTYSPRTLHQARLVRLSHGLDF